MSTPPPPGGQPPYDPNQPYGQGAMPPAGGYGAPPAQNHPRAMTSLILGILGIVCCSICAPFAWSIGKKAVNEIDASGGRFGGRGQAQAGYILGIIGTVLLAISLVVVIISLITGGFSFQASTS